MGVIVFNSKKKGVSKLSELEIDADKDWGMKKIIDTGILVTPSPPSGYCKVLNVYVDPTTEKLTVEYDDTPTP